MIKLLRLQNFKCFEDQIFSFRPLTLLTGLNGSGKSSVIQSLLLLRQSYEQEVLIEGSGLALNGDLVHIGTAHDALFENAKENIIGFELELENGVSNQWSFNYEGGQENADVLSFAESQSETSSIVGSSLFTKNFHYLQAERVGPRRFFETSDFLVRQQMQLGAAGEYTAHFLSVFEKTSIFYENLRHPTEPSRILRDQIEAWLGEISPGVRINLTPILNTDTVNLQYSFALSNQYRSTNVGFGLTYILPILVAVLTSKQGTLLIIENPEVHLHPKGQVPMCGLLARAASCGLQVIIETHSDHVLNGIRLAVHDGKLSPDDVQLHFLQRNAQDGVAQVTSPHMDRDGRIDQWPDDFFDEWEKSLVALLEPRGN